MSGIGAWARARTAPVFPTISLRVPLVEQNSDYSCGSAAMAAVLRYWLGKASPSNEEALRAPLGTNPEEGTEVDALVRLGAASGLEATKRVGMSTADLRAILARGRTVIVAFQAWKSGGGSWADEWASGHYAVLVGMDDSRAWFMDPSTPDTYAFVELPEFEQRWHDIDADGRQIHGAGVVVWGDAPLGGASTPLVAPRPLR